jgi:chromosome segregation ATPase
MNSFFIGAKNVCIMFNPSKPIHITPFINHCDKLFGWASEYYKKRGSNKIYVIFSTLVRGQEFFHKIENNDIFIEFPSEVFIDNIPYIVRMRGYRRDNCEQLCSLLPNIENVQKVIHPVTNLENNDNKKKNDCQHLDEYINKKCADIISNTINKYEDELKKLKNKIKSIEDENKNLQFVIRQQTNVTSLILEKTVKTDNELSALHKQNEYTDMRLCDNANNVTKVQNEIYNFQNWAEITQELLNNETAKINSIKLSVKEITHNTQIKNESFQLDISKINERKKWSEHIGQCQHQYALEKCNLFESRISQLEKNHKSIVSKPVEITLANTIENTALFTNQIIEPIQIVETTQDINLKQAPININDNDDYYGEDDDNMFVIIKEEI